jgi:putative ABC transport system permease protein
MIPLRYNLRSVSERYVTSSLTILGIALVAMIMVVLLGFVGGLRKTLLNTATSDSWIILSRGVSDETAGYLPLETIEILRNRSELARSSSGEPLFSPEIFRGVSVSAEKAVKRFALLRGTAPIAYRVHRNMRLVDGHWPRRGHSEWVVGQKLETRYPYLRPDTKFHFGRREWSIVGVFSDNDSARESEIWTNIDDLKVDGQIERGYANSIHIVLRNGLDKTLQTALRKDSRLRVNIVSEQDYYAAQTKIANQLQTMGVIVAVALAVGAVFGGMNTMYSAIAMRVREIGSLRVLGFTRLHILSSFILESMIFGIAGGLLGNVLALFVSWSVGLNSRLMSVGTLFYSYRPSLDADAVGILLAIAVGIAGGVLPAARAARMRITDTLRDA